MSANIDTGQSYSYDANYPKPHVQQSSQQFRDNFSIIQSAVESLFNAETPDNSDVLKIVTEVSDLDGAVTFDVSYWNNGFRLPQGQATANTATGMICYDSTKKLQFFDGTNWLDVVNKDASGLVTLSTLTVNQTLLVPATTPTQPREAISLAYLNGRITLIENSIDQSNTNWQAAIDAVQADLDAEKQNRSDADADLQAQIDELDAALNANAAVASDLQTQINNLSNALVQEANTRSAADTAHSGQISTLNTEIGATNQILNQVIGDFQQEIADRIANDALLSARIDAIDTNSDNLANALAQEVIDRTNGDLALNNSIANTNTQVSQVKANAITLTARVTTLENTQVRTFYQPNDPAANGTIQDGSIWFNSSNNAVFRYDMSNSGWTAVGATNDANAVSKLGDTMTGNLRMSNANVVISAGSGVFFQNMPNAITSDGAYIIYDKHNPVYANSAGATEQSVLRIGSTNDGTGSNADSIAVESAADIWLAPGRAGGGKVFIGNAAFVATSFDPNTGDIVTKGDVQALSDASIKTNVVVIANALSKVDAIRGVTFNRLDLPNNPEQMGVIAQEVQPVAPQLVHQLPSGLLAVSYPNLTALLIEAIKELKAEVDALKKKLGE